jgi:indole-3-glycerol phosphate synthase
VGAETASEMNMLESMVRAAEADARSREERLPLERLEERSSDRGDRRPFGEALAGPGISAIAEFKRSSPTFGAIAPDTDISAQVRGYQRSGAAALSVLTDRKNFGGSVDDLTAARRASDLPILRKDFISSRYQLLEAAVFGADAILLIVAALETQRLDELYREAHALDLDCIVEVRTAEELEVALEIDADIVGINNRDLDTLDVDVKRTFDLMHKIPIGKTVVSESGIERPDQVAALQDVGVDAVLIGHQLMHAQDAEVELRHLLGSDDGTAEHAFP